MGYHGGRLYSYTLTVSRTCVGGYSKDLRTTTGHTRVVTAHTTIWQSLPVLTDTSGVRYSTDTTALVTAEPTHDRVSTGGRYGWISWLSRYWGICGLTWRVGWCGLSCDIRGGSCRRYRCARYTTHETSRRLVRWHTVATYVVTSSPSACSAGAVTSGSRRERRLTWRESACRYWGICGLAWRVGR